MTPTLTVHVRNTALLAGGLAALYAVLSLAVASTPPTAVPQGRWLTASGNLEVDVAPCGEALCGTVVKVLSNKSMSNPNVEMKPADAQSALGMKILTEFTPSGDGEWHGKIYNRENGKTYSCYLSLAAPDQLKLRAYIGIPLFGQTHIWKRVESAAAAK